MTAPLAEPLHNLHLGLFCSWSLKSGSSRFGGVTVVVFSKAEPPPEESYHQRNRQVNAHDGAVGRGLEPELIELMSSFI